VSHALPRRLACLLLLGGIYGAAGCNHDTEREPGPGASAPAASGAARDVLLITVDTLRADATGFGGNPRVATPALDRLAAAGQVFRQAHAHNVVTLPSHANILTGRLPFEHGVRDNSGFVLPAGVSTAGEYFKEAGFATAAVVGAFPLDARFGLARGFDLYDDRYPEGSEVEGFRLVERRGDEVVAAGLAWWRRHEGERRFLWVHLFDPHAPYEPPEPFASRYADAPYLGEVAAVDAFLAPLLHQVLDVDDKPAMVVFTSDHGESLGEHGELTHGLFAYEATLHVPLVVRAPGLAPGEIEAPARHIDVLPTLLDGAGLAVPPSLPGRSLLGVSAASAGTPSTYFEALTANLTRGWAPLRGVISGGDKLIVLPVPELYDLASDPAEVANAFGERRDRDRELARLLPEETPWPPRPGAVTAEERSALRSLGYLAASGAAKDRFTEADDPKNLVQVDREIFRFIELFQEGHLEEATTVAREVVRLQPEMSAGYSHLAQALLERGRQAEALAALEDGVRNGAADPQLLRQLALLHAETGHPEKGVPLLAPLAPAGDPETLTALGLVLAESGRPAEARAVLERVFERDPRNPAARQNLALVELRSERWAEAERQARLALDLNHELPLAWNYLGVARYNLGRPREAMDAWEHALALQPSDFDVLYNLAVVALEAGDRGRARSALARFVAEAPPERYRPDIRKARSLLASLERAHR
jgi:arylsulfatase A-like enzyme/Flp pilus assembly protein TadD